MPNATTPREVVDRLFREEHGRAVATLIRTLGDFDLAEESLQDAYLVALGGRQAVCPPIRAAGSSPPPGIGPSIGFDVPNA